MLFIIDNKDSVRPNVCISLINSKKDLPLKVLFYFYLTSRMLNKSLYHI